MTYVIWAIYIVIATAVGWRTGTLAVDNNWPMSKLYLVMAVEVAIIIVLGILIAVLT